jgi:hypothetical protein
MLGHLPRHIPVAIATLCLGIAAVPGATAALPENGPAVKAPPSLRLAIVSKAPRDRTPPSLTINQAATQADPTSSAPLHFTAKFSEAVSGFTSSDVRLTGTAGATSATVTDTGDHKTFDVAVSGMKTSGTAVATVPAGAATDAAGNRSFASRSTDNTVTFALPAPTPSPLQTTTTTTSTTATASTPAPTPSPAPSSSGLIVGTIVNAAEGGTPALDMAASAGTHWIREDLWWPAVEPTQGRQDWSGYDSLFLNAAQRGIHILPIIDGTPAWAGSSSWAMPADPTAYATFAGQVAARYGAGGAFWQSHAELAQYAPVYFELWNEPWWPQFSQPVDPARYARLVKAAGQAIHSANPQAKAIAATDWQYSLDGGATWRSSWTDAMLAAVPDLGAYVDAFSVHPYSDHYNVDVWTGSNWQTAKLDKEIRPDLVSHGLGDKPIWVTEIGWPTCASACGGFTEADQAANITLFDQLVRTQWTYVKAVFYYRLDEIGTSRDVTDREQWFGVLRPDGSHKPGYEALTTALRS